MSQPCQYPFPATIDSSMLRAWRSCRRKFFYLYIRRIQAKGESIHLTFGGAFAAALERARRAFFVEGKSEELSLALGLEVLWKVFGNPPVPERSAKTWDRLAAAYESYLCDAYPMSSEPMCPALIGDKRAIEFTFCFPIPLSHPETGDPISISGRCDAIATYRHHSGFYCIDEKTATSFPGDWADRWQLRSQFGCYSFAAHLYGFPVIGTVVRGTAILKEDIRHQEAIVQYPDWKLARWYDTMLEDVQEMIQSWQHDKWRLNLDEACVEYNKVCEFQPLCRVKEPEQWISINYQPNTWNPLQKTDA